MSKIKLPRKSTNIDMTAMCDVAFLLLTFFMLATKFKPAEPVEVVTPGSVSSSIIPDRDVLLITIDKKGQVYFQLDNSVKKFELITILNDERNLGLSENEIFAFVNAPSMGIPFSKLKKFLKLSAEDPEKGKEYIQNGIPVDSANNELIHWLNASLKTYSSKKLNLLIKGDNDVTYPSFKNVIEAFKINEQNKFLLVTKQEDAPVGTALYETRNK